MNHQIIYCALSCILQIEFFGPFLTIAMEQPSFVSSCASSYDVFLSFRGEDVRKNFVDHLYSAMEQRGIYTFKDDEKLERGKSISPEVERAIEESSMAVVVLSEHYADSTWCLEELVKIMECMEVKGQMVVPIFYGVDPSTVRKQKGKFGEAFEGHEKRFEKEGEKVKKWRKVLENVSNLSGWNLDNTENGLLTAGGFQHIKASPFPSLSGLSSLEMLDLSDCSMLDGGIILGDLGELHCLKILNLSNNKFGCIPAESIVGLTRLKQLHVVGCKRLQSLPDLPSSIIEVYADECPSLEGRSIDSLTKYPKLSRVSFTKCAQLLEDPRYGHIVDAIWQHLLKGLSNDPNHSISVYFPGMVFPEWFTYKNWGNSLSVTLPQNWYNNKFMGFAFCVVSNLITTPTSGESYSTITKNYGLDVEIIPTTRDGHRSSFTSTMGFKGVKQNMKSELTCLSYKSFHSYYNHNEWCQIEVSGYLDSVYTGIGMRLVYEDDVKTSDVPLMIQNNTVSTKYDDVVRSYGGHFF